MNIAHLLPYGAKFPLVKHNGRYEWAHRLAKKQAEIGHTVTIYSAPNSSDDNTSITWSSPSEDMGDKISNNEALMKLAFQNSEHDIFHSHFDSLHYALANLTDKPVVSTQHWFPTQSIADVFMQNPSENVLTVAPTHYMADQDSKLGINPVQVIHHGIDLGLFKPSGEQSGSRLLFVGRITPSKGVYEAVQAAKSANIGLDIVGKLNDVDKDYWAKVEPLVDGDQITYHGAKTLAEVAEFMSNAFGFIFPSSVPEAFGQVTIEAQACGAPVIISSIGASSELVAHGKTGFVVNEGDEYVQAIQNIYKINRADCVELAQKFDINNMFDAYERLYRQLTN